MFKLNPEMFPAASTLYDFSYCTKYITRVFEKLLFPYEINTLALTLAHSSLLET